ncbi:acetyltransferase [Castellaniella sp.]|uniref:acetyltransferase n=1 Tax=Castellaniella sp. TaxID=1955812 RepID=UPI003C74B2AD
MGVLGASGHGKVVAETALAAGWESVIFYDDAWPHKSAIGRWAIVGDGDALLAALGDLDGVIVAIGRNEIRLSLLDRLRSAGASVSTIIHPAAVVSGSVSLGAGSVVMPGAIVNADARIGDGSILNTGCSIDHDCVLGNAVHVSPGARLAGGVSVGDRSWIGIGAVVRQGQCIGQDVVVGAGAAVVSDLPDGVVAVGVPARPLSTCRSK